MAMQAAEIEALIKSALPDAIVTIEDQRPNKKGVKYELPAPISEGRKNEFVKYDRTAILSLEALGLSGQEFKVEENTEFALPPGADKKDYKVTKVTPESVVVEYTDSAGAKKTVEIAKGGFPTIAE